MTEIIGIVANGATKLIGLISIWAGAKTDAEREEIRQTAISLVGGLDAYFAKKDAEDMAAQAALQAKIDAAP